METVIQNQACNNNKMCFMATVAAVELAKVSAEAHTDCSLHIRG